MPNTFDEYINAIEQVGREHDLPLDLRSADAGEAIADFRDACECRTRLRVMEARGGNLHDRFMLARMLGTIRGKYMVEEMTATQQHDHPYWREAKLTLKSSGEPELLEAGDLVFVVKEDD